MSSPCATRQAGRHVAYRQWAADEAFREGDFAGTTCRDDSLVIEFPTATRDITAPEGDGDPVTFEVASWTSPEITPDEPFVELVASWNAKTPAGTWIEISVEVAQGQHGDRSTYVLGRWAETTSDIHSTSVADQVSDLASVDFDVLLAHPGRPFSSWRLTVSLFRRAGTQATPTVSLAGAMVSGPAPGSTEDFPTSNGSSVVRTLAVPAYSQVVHRGEYPEFNGGGEAWCSPTATAMVMAYWQRGPSPEDYAWVNPAYADPWIAHAAAHTFDRAYSGAGNWPFNTAYAARFELTAFVTRLRSLTEAETFIAAGIPLVAAISFAQGPLTGAGYNTEGHLLVIVGFTSTGDVVVNDPASHSLPSNDEVKTVYDRAEFERVWVTGSGGIVYVIRPADVPLPPGPDSLSPNW